MTGVVLAGLLAACGGSGATSAASAPKSPKGPKAPHANGPKGPKGPAIRGRPVMAFGFDRGMADVDRVAGFQSVASNRIRSAPAPGADGGRAARFSVTQGDNPVDENDRAEISFGVDEKEGVERWYSWRTRFAKGFPTWAEWQLVAQFHSIRNGVPPVALYAEDGELRLRVPSPDMRRPRFVFRLPLRTQHWYDITLHVKWSDNPRVGFVQAWVNGKPAGVKTYVNTLYPGQPNYFKLGYYRSRYIGGTGVVFHDSLRVTQVSP